MGLLAEVLFQLLAELLELGLAGGELGQPGLRVRRHEVQVVARGRGQRGLDRGVTGAVDRARGQAGELVRVVGRAALQLLVGRDDAVRVQSVHHGAVQLQFHVVVEPVVDDPGDLRVVRGAAALGLNEAGHGDDLARGHVHGAGGRGQVVAVGFLIEPGHHALEHAGGGLVRLHLVGRREQVALGLATRVRGQSERPRRLEGLLEIGQRDAGMRPELSLDLAQPPALGDGDLVLDARGRVEQQLIGQRGLHLLLHPVETRLQRGRAGAVLGGELERPHAGHHAQRDQALADLGRALPVLHLDDGLAGAGGGVVGRVVTVLDGPVDVEPAHPDRDQQDDQDDHERDQPAAAALAGTATAATPPGPATAPTATPAGASAVVLVVVLVVAAAETGHEPPVVVITVFVVPLRLGLSGRGPARGGPAGPGHVLDGFVVVVPGTARRPIRAAGVAVAVGVRVAGPGVAVAAVEVVVVGLRRPPGPVRLAGAEGPVRLTGLVGLVGPRGFAGLEWWVRPTGLAGLARTLRRAEAAGSARTVGAAGPAGPVGPAGKARPGRPT